MERLISTYWPLLLPAALGGVAVYLLLPCARRFPPLYGAAFAGLALVATGWLVIRADGDFIETLLFYVFAGLAVLFGGLMICQRNPVHAALSFAMVVLSTCGLFLLQAAPFLMAATIIIYAGAIVVTFLFVIMLAQQGGLSNADQRSREPFLATVAGFVLLGSLLCVLHESYNGPKADKLDAFIVQAESAHKTETVDDWKKLFGKDDEFFIEFRKFVAPTRIRPTLDVPHHALANALESAQLKWAALKPSEFDPLRDPSAEQLHQFKDDLAKVLNLAKQIRQSEGTLLANHQLPLSKTAGATANDMVPLDKDGKPAERLPAANVAGLGKTLFTDYLLAVELAGTLLLVATIGAIAIAGRREGGLR